MTAADLAKVERKQRGAAARAQGESMETGRLWTFTIPGPPVTWERVTPMGKHATRTRKTRQHEQAVHALATAHGVRAGRGPVRLTVEAFFPDRRRRDLDNIGKAILDGLRGAPVLDDDCWAMVPEVILRGELDAANPRTVVTVEVLT